MHKKIAATIMFAVFCMATLHIHGINYKNPKIYTITIQFPQSITQAPEVRAYHNGTKLIREAGITDHKAYFSMCCDRYQTEFILLVVDPKNLDAQAEENSVKYYCVKPDTPYKLFSLKLKERTAQPKKEDAATTTPDYTPNFYWETKEVYLDATRKLPDSTIIIFYDPAFIESLSGGNIVELPTIFIKNDIMSLLGSRVNLEEVSAGLILGAIDFDPFHKPLEQRIQHLPASTKTILAFTA